MVILLFGNPFYVSPINKLRTHFCRLLSLHFNPVSCFFSSDFVACVNENSFLLAFFSSASTLIHSRFGGCRRAHRKKAQPNGRKCDLQLGWYLRHAKISELSLTFALGRKIANCAQGDSSLLVLYLHTTPGLLTTDYRVAVSFLSTPLSLSLSHQTSPTKMLSATKLEL